MNGYKSEGISSSDYIPNAVMKYLPLSLLQVNKTVHFDKAFGWQYNFRISPAPSICWMILLLASVEAGAGPFCIASFVPCTIHCMVFNMFYR